MTKNTKWNPALYCGELADLMMTEENEGGNSAGGEETLDPLFDQAVNFVLEKWRASISSVQRQFRMAKAV